MAEQETNVVTDTTEQNTGEKPGAENQEAVFESAEIAKQKAEMAKLKAALDKATKEAAESKRALRAKQSAEEAAAEEAQAHQEAIEKELKELRKERSVANTSKKVFTFIQDEATATGIAEALYGAEDIDLAVDMFSKAWTAREKALRIEYGKIPAPGVGASDGPTITRERLDGMTFVERAKFANAHPEEYAKLMGR